MGGGSNAADQARKQQEEQQKKINAATGRIDRAFSGFTPEFYNQRAQDYENYAMPQLNQQYTQTAENLTGKLANQGLLNSSAALGQRSALQEALATQQQGVANQGIQQAQDLQRQQMSEQQQLIGQATSATDPLSISNQALSAASQFQAPSAFAPLGQMFQGFGNMYLGNQLASTYNPRLSSYMLGGNRQPSTGGLGMSSQVIQ
jgi:hypothetical protein